MKSEQTSVARQHTSEGRLLLYGYQRSHQQQDGFREAFTDYRHHHMSQPVVIGCGALETVRMREGILVAIDRRSCLVLFTADQTETDRKYILAIWKRYRGLPVAHETSAILSAQ